MAKKDKNETKVIKMNPHRNNPKVVPLQLSTGHSKAYSTLIYTYQNHA